MSALNDTCFLLRIKRVAWGLISTWLNFALVWWFERLINQRLSVVPNNSLRERQLRERALMSENTGSVCRAAQTLKESTLRALRREESKWNDFQSKNLQNRNRAVKMWGRGQRSICLSVCCSIILHIIHQFIHPSVNLILFYIFTLILPSFLQILFSTSV